jgi:polysaccharide pyruvyl transferase WcaK-like protein
VDPAPPRVFFVGDTSHRTNWGCRATTAALRRLVGESGEITATMDLKRLDALLPREGWPAPAWRNPPNRVARLATRTFSAARDHSLHAIRNVDAASVRSLSNDLRRRRILPHVHDAIDACDVVVFNAEGGVIGRRPSGRLVFFLAYAARTAFDKPAVIVNHTADLRDPSMRALAKIAYGVVDDAVVRERFSLDDVTPLRMGAPTALAADAAFTYRPAPDEWKAWAARPDTLSIYPDRVDGFDPREPYICVGGSSAYNDAGRDTGALVRDFLALCRRLQSIAPVVVTAASEPDDEILRPVARQLGLPYLGLSTPTQVAVDLLGSATLYVGGRWHPSIMALTGGTPIIEFGANSDYKSKGIVEIAGLEQPEIAAHTVGMQIDVIAELAATHVAGGAQRRAALLDRIHAFAGTAADNVRLLRRAISPPVAGDS